jgi:TatD DNase family protein
MAIQRVINKRHWKEIVFCGFGEPLTRLDAVLEVTEQTTKHYPNTIRVVTNGQGQLINENRNVTSELKQAGIDKISVSLNAQNALIYDLVCKPKLANAFQEVLNFIEKAKDKMDTELTVLTIPEVEIAEVREIAARLGVKFRIREYIPCFW